MNMAEIRAQLRQARLDIRVGAIPINIVTVQLQSLTHAHARCCQEPQQRPQRRAFDRIGRSDLIRHLNQSADILIAIKLRRSPANVVG